MNLIFDKTDKGREEISTRKYRLAPRLRTLLLLIDGKKSTDILLQKIAGLDGQSISELQVSGFIQPIGESDSATTVSESVTDSTTIQAQPADITAPVIQDPTQVDKAITAKPLAEEVADAVADAETSQFKALQAFYTETIRTKIGLRGYSLQQIVDQAVSVRALRELRESYLAAVTKAKGESIAQNMAVRLDQLLDAENADMLRK